MKTLIVVVFCGLLAVSLAKPLWKLDEDDGGDEGGDDGGHDGGHDEGNEPPKLYGDEDGLETFAPIPDDPEFHLNEDGLETYAPEDPDKLYPVTDEPEKLLRTSHRRGDATLLIAPLVRHSKSAPSVLHRTLHRRGDAHRLITALAQHSQNGPHFLIARK